MFNKVKTDTYIFSGDGVHHRNNKGIETDSRGNLVVYDKESTVDVIFTRINKNQITKGIKVDNTKDKYISYLFNYKISRNGEEEKRLYRIKINKKDLEANEKYVNRLDALVSSVQTVRKYNRVKAIGFYALTTTMLAGAMVYALAQPALEKNEETQIETSVGEIKTYEDFLNDMQKQGITQEEIDSWNMEEEHKVR